jgi:hypothetical protein
LFPTSTKAWAEELRFCNIAVAKPAAHTCNAFIQWNRIQRFRIEEIIKGEKFITDLKHRLVKWKPSIRSKDAETKKQNWLLKHVFGFTVEQPKFIIYFSSYQM